MIFYLKKQNRKSDTKRSFHKKLLFSRIGILHLIKIASFNCFSKCQIVNDNHSSIHLVTMMI